MQPVFFSSILDTVASRAFFVAAAFCRDDQTWLCCLCVIVWGAKNGLCRMLSCRVVSCCLSVSRPLMNSLFKKLKLNSKFKSELLKA